MSTTSSHTDIRLLDAGVTEMNHLPDFGRVEAKVRILFRKAPLGVVEKATVITSVNARKGENLADLRQRLAEDAVRLWSMIDDQDATVRPSYELPFAA